MYFLVSFPPTLFSVVKSPLEGIKFLYVQVMVCGPWDSQSLCPAVQQSFHVIWGYMWGPSVYSGRSWDLNTMGIFQITRSIANGCCLGGMGGRQGVVDLG